MQPGGAGGWKEDQGRPRGEEEPQCRAALLGAFGLGKKGKKTGAAEG